MIYKRLGQVPTAADQEDRGRGREKWVAPARSLLSSLGQTLFTCRLQVAVAGPVNTTGSWLGSIRSLEQGIWGHCYSLPAKACFLPNSLRPTQPEALQRRHGSIYKQTHGISSMMGLTLACEPGWVSEWLHCAKMIVILSARCRVNTALSIVHHAYHPCPFYRQEAEGPGNYFYMPVFPPSV